MNSLNRIYGAIWIIIYLWCQNNVSVIYCTNFHFIKECVILYIMICTFTLNQIDILYIYILSLSQTLIFHILVIITGYFDNTFDKINIYYVINYINCAHLHVIILTHTHTHTHTYIYNYIPYCYNCYRFYHGNINIKL